MATRTRSAAHDVPQWSVAIREQRSPAESRRGRVVANNAQLVVLRALYNRTGDNPTKEDVEEVVRETGL
ncbi:hypothetical protein C8T65DRAFT_295148 [Cerioporus squamosus]|nr:hypothetical protein C8T65DRAFT_295148 [Cerioporus squamosus]